MFRTAAIFLQLQRFRLSRCISRVGIDPLDDALAGAELQRRDQTVEFNRTARRGGVKRAEQSDHTVRSCRGPAGGFGALSVCVERRSGWDVPGKHRYRVRHGLPPSGVVTGMLLCWLVCGPEECCCSSPLLSSTRQGAIIKKQSCCCSHAAQGSASPLWRRPTNRAPRPRDSCCVFGVGFLRQLDFFPTCQRLQVLLKRTGLTEEEGGGVYRSLPSN